jgi:diacylglycerol kinase (ATP)
MQRRFLFLLNPRAGTHKGPHLPALIQQRCNEAQVEYTIDHSRADADYNWLRTKITHEFITDVVVAGGDGTISTVVAAIRDLPVSIGIIPRGSGNGLAFAAGISKDATKALDIIFKGKPQQVDAFMINEHFSCMLSGLGFDAQIAHEFDRQQKRGFWKYTQLTLRNLTGIKPFLFHVQSKDLNLSLHAFFISIANSNQFGNLFNLLVRVLWHIRFGTFTSDYAKRKGITYFQTDELVIENPGLAPFHIDGDGKQTAEKFTVKIIPGAYSLLMP